MPTTARRIAQQQRSQQTTISGGAGYQQYISHLQTMRTNFNSQIDNLILGAPSLWGTGMSSNAGTVSGVTSIDRQKNPRAVAAGRKGAAARRRALAARQQQPQGKTATAGRG